MNKFGESISSGPVDPPSPTAAELGRRLLQDEINNAICGVEDLVESLKAVDFYDSALKGGSHFINLSRPGAAGHLTNIYQELKYLQEYLGGLAEDLDWESWKSR